MAREREADVGRELADELHRYKSVQTLRRWPVVAETGHYTLNTYHALKKQGELSGVVLAAWEGLVAIWCRCLVLPALRTRLVQAPLSLADHTAHATLSILQRAMPQLRQQPSHWDWRLAARLALLPLTLSVAVGHTVLEAMADLLTHAAPSLRPTAAGFEDRTLIGQWLMLCVMTTVLLPAHLMAAPLQTAKQMFTVPTQMAQQLISKPAETAAQLLALVPQYVDKAWQLVSDIYQSNISETVARLQSLALGIIRWARDTITSTLSAFRAVIVRFTKPLWSIATVARHPVASLEALVRQAIARVLNAAQTAARLLRRGVTSMLALTLATGEAAYYVVFQATGLQAWLQWVLKTVQTAGTGAGQRLGAVLPAALRPTSRPAAHARAQWAAAAAPGRLCSACGSARAADGPAACSAAGQLDRWGWRRLSGALLLTLTVAAAALALLLARCA